MLTFGFGAGAGGGGGGAADADLHAVAADRRQFHPGRRSRSSCWAGSAASGAPISAASLIGITEALAGFYLDPALKQAVWFAIFILVLVVRPSGLFGLAGAEEIGLRAQE